MRNFSYYVIMLMVTHLPFCVNGQEAKCKLRGTIVDNLSQLPLEYATVTLYHIEDSTIATGGITDSSGEFMLSIPKGQYFAFIGFIGFKDKRLENITLDHINQDLNLGVLPLELAANHLEEVEVRAEKSSVYFALDKRVFNVGKGIANAGGTGVEVLNNVPGVSVDVDGSVSIRGSQGIQILVDGKPSGLFTTNPAQGLRNLPTNLIDRVEVITNPSAKYEAKGTAGIINIILRKEKEKGFNGNIDLTAGAPQRYGGTFNFNVRKKALNLYSNLSLQHQANIGDRGAYQEFYRDNTTTEILENQGNHERYGLSGSSRIGLDYFIKPHSTINTSFFYQKSNMDHQSSIDFTDFINDVNLPVSKSNRSVDEEEIATRMEYTLSYKREFKSKDHKLTADFSYQDNSEKETTAYVEQFFLADESPSGKIDLIQRALNEDVEQRWIAKLDYSLPIKKSKKFETGWQSTFRNIKNDYLVEVLENDDWNVFEDLNNIFEYKEIIHAAYAIYGGKLNKLEYQMGFRVEHSEVTTSLEQSQQSKTRKYTDYFPSFHLTYNFPNQHSIQLSYSRRIFRPRFRSLNPSFSLRDRRTRFSGNPDLQPEYTGTYELGYIKHWEKGTFSSSLFFRHSVDVIEGVIHKVIVLDSLPTSFRRPENLLQKDDLGFEFNGTYNPSKQLKFIGNLYLYRAIYTGQNPSDGYDAETYTARGRLTSRVSLFQNTDVQIRWNYRAPMQRPQGRRKTVSSVDISISQPLFQKRVRLTASIIDLFNTWFSRGTFETDNLFREDYFRWQGRRGWLVLGWKLGK